VSTLARVSLFGGIGLVGSLFAAFLMLDPQSPGFQRTPRDRRSVEKARILRGYAIALVIGITFALGAIGYALPSRLPQ
jgi:hypothetical protein